MISEYKESKLTNELILRAENLWFDGPVVRPNDLSPEMFKGVIMFKKIIISFILGFSLHATAQAAVIPQDFSLNNGGSVQWESDLFFFRLDYPQWTQLLEVKLAERHLELLDISSQIKELEHVSAHLKEGREKQESIFHLESLKAKEKEVRESIFLYLAEEAKTEQDKKLLETKADRNMLAPLIYQEDGYEMESSVLLEEEYTMPTTGKETSPFGWRVHPVTSNRSLHQGIDLANDAGTPIRAVKSGIVTAADYNEISGNNILIRHYDGQETAYYHMQKRLVERGQSVRRGEIIGLMGTTGRSTGNHLHFELRINQVQVDPAPYIYRGSRWEVP